MLWRRQPLREPGEVVGASPPEHRRRPVDLVAHVNYMYPGHDSPDLGRNVRPCLRELRLLYGAG